MTEVSLPQITQIEQPPQEAEFAMNALPAASGVIVSPFNVRTSDGTVLMSWEDSLSSQASIPLSEKVLESFVLTARRVVSRFPNSPRAKTNLAIALLRNGEVDEAVALLKAASASDPNDALTVLTLADAYLRNEQAEEAESLLRVLTRRDPANVRASLALSNALLSRGALDEARDKLVQILEWDRSPRVRFMLGIIELKAGNLSKAVGMLRAATHEDVKNAQFHHALGVVYALQRNYDRAEASFKAALSLYSRSRETIHALGQVFLENGKPDDAVRLLKTSVEKYSSDMRIRVLLAQAFIAADKHESALSIVKSTLQDGRLDLTDDQRVYLLNIMAASYVVGQKLKEAELALRRAIEIGPRVTSVSYENLSRLYLYHLESPETAIAPLRRAKQLFPRAQMTRVLLAISLASCDDLTSAIEELVPVWREGRAEESVYVCLGWLYQRAGKPKDAISVLGEGLARFPSCLQIINNLGYTYLMLGDVVNGRQVLGTIPKDLEPHTELVATLGLLALWEGRVDQGREMYERAEHMATKAGFKLTARKAKQKKHLEVARMLMRNNKNAEASLEIHEGLRIKEFPLSYREDLLALKDEIGAAR